MQLFKDYTFDAAHFLPYVPEDHKCRRMHGHTYRVRLCLEGPLDPKLGWVRDFADIKKYWKPLEERLDHHLLNEIPGLENPTAEHIAIWIYRQLKPDLQELAYVELYETPRSGVRYSGELEKG